MKSASSQFLLLTIFLLFSPVAPAELVRVKMTHLQFPLTIEGTGIEIKGLKKSNIEEVSIPQKKEVRISYRKNLSGPLWLVEEGGVTRRLSQKFLEITADQKQMEVRGGSLFSFKGTLLLSPTSQGVDLIGAFPLEEYLEGVLLGEMPTQWPLEALKAQAVAARSYTLHQMDERAKSPFHVERDVLDQVFSTGTVNREREREKIRKALAATSGLVLKEKGRVLKAYYHSDCGGQTEDPERIWGEKGSHTKSLKSVTDSHCALRPPWEIKISLAELKEKLDSADHKLPPGPLDEIRVVTRTTSQRVALVAFNEGDEHILLSGNELRRLLGFNRLKSTLFNLSLSDDKNSVVFKGRGFGHGSGLCQWGAKYLADAGASAQSILRHYYPTAQISEVDVANR